MPDEYELPPEVERQLERMVTAVFWVFAVCLSVFAVTLTIVGVLLLWRLV